VEQERAIKENELNTEIAVENKKRQIRETQMEGERAVQEKKHLLEKEGLEANIGLEDRRKSLVVLAAETPGPRQTPEHMECRVPPDPCRRLASMSYLSYRLVNKAQTTKRS
jgi:hypothetical protein